MPLSICFPSIIPLLSNNRCSVSHFSRFDYLDVSCIFPVSLWIISPKSIHVEACATVPFFFIAYNVFMLWV